MKMTASEQRKNTPSLINNLGWLGYIVCFITLTVSFCKKESPNGLVDTYRTVAQFIMLESINDAQRSPAEMIVLNEKPYSEISEKEAVVTFFSEEETVEIRKDGSISPVKQERGAHD